MKTHTHLRNRITLALVLAAALTALPLARAKEVIYETGFEDTIKGTYGAAAVDIDGVQWILDNVLIGTAEGDRRNGDRSARFRFENPDNVASMTMLGDFAEGVGEVSFLYARFSSDAEPPAFVVESSVNGGDTWETAGGPFVTADVNTLTEATVRVLRSGNVRLRFRAVPPSGDNQRFNLDDLVVTAFDESLLRPPPSEYPAAFALDGADATILRASWTDAASEPVPDGYYVFVAADGEPAAPVDGVEPETNLDLSAGTGVARVAHGVENVEFSGMQGGTTYTATIHPFANRAENILFLTDPPVPTTTLATPLVLLSQDFYALGDWTVFTAGAQAEWAVSDGQAVANAFGSTGPADDWLISPAVDLTGTAGAVIDIRSRTQFVDEGVFAGISVLVSTDYDGGDPPEATWTELLPPLPGRGTNEWFASGSVSLSRFADETVQFAFRYISSGTTSSSSELWALDSVTVLAGDEVFPIPNVTLAVDPEAFREDVAAGEANLTVSIPNAHEEALPVSLRSRSPDILTVPATATIPSGATSVTVEIAPVAGLALETAAEVVIEARSSAAAGSTATVTVLPTTLAEISLSVEPAAVFEADGTDAAALTVTLSEAPAEYPVTVVLESSDPGAAAVPTKVIIDEGLSAEVPVNAIQDGVFTGDRMVTLTASGDRLVPASVQLTVRESDPPPELSLALDPVLVFDTAGPEASRATLTLSAPPPADYPVSFTLAADPPGILQVPASVTVASGLETTFDVGVIEGSVTAQTSVSLRAEGEPFVAAAAALDVRPAESAGPPALALVLPERLGEGESGSALVFLPTAPDADVTVSLVSSDTTELEVPAQVVIPAGFATAAFTVHALPDGIMDGDQTVTVVASAAGYASASASLVVEDRDIPRSVELLADTDMIDEGNELLVIARLSTPAGIARELRLSTTSGLLAVPPSLEVHADAVEIPFVVEAVEDGVYRPDRVVTVVAEIDGYSVGRLDLLVRNTDPRGRFVRPLPGQTFAVGQSVLIEIELEGNLDSLIDVTLFIDGSPATQWTRPPFRTEESFDSLGPRVLTAEVRDDILRDETLPPTEIEIVFNPVVNKRDFVIQLYADMFDREPTTSEFNRHITSLENGQRTRVQVAAELFRSSEFERIRAGKSMVWHLYRRFPDWEEFFRTPIFMFQFQASPIGGPTIVQSQGWNGFLGFTSNLFFDSLGLQPGGLLGLAYHGVHRSVEFEEALGGRPADLPDRDIFARFWANRHDSTPTPQQIVQAFNRMEVFRAQKDSIYQNLSDRSYGRARFLDALVRGEMVNGQDIIWGPPNSNWRDIVRVSSLWMTLWSGDPDNGLPPFEGTPAEALARADEDIEDIIASLLDHPRYWERFGQSWMGAQPDGGDRHTSGWFGEFHYTADSFPWVTHAEHGWIYAGSGGANGGGWFHDGGLGWLLTSERLHPWVYRAETRSWIYHANANGGGRRFYDTATDEWFEAGLR
ncbi:MAG: choice-of-anchor J domain-containing protein [Opitutales bacterium]|nr:choice-of-anchor J domain-containing protein [Opitutales bacterium]